MRLTLKLLLPIVFIVIISGCNNNEDTFDLLIFSEIQNSKVEEVERFVKKADVFEEDKFTVQMHPVTYERLIVEIASHNGDLYLLDEELMSAAYDPIGLYPLDEALNEDWFLKTPREYKALNPEEGIESVYAFPLGNQSNLLNSLGVQLEKPLVAIIPIYSGNKAFSIELLQYIIESN
ncbi:hypothetical protein [Halalkalibacter krulwichiae]|uniref:Putative lipoprotein YteS n=1 Tax=Halalkalibacter krulwichiae TaxID=199441 RepID=A0A1X9M813_9BACI|nr:hypothetical protein [Halalkalibacter krulwichiae]ARK29547.1 Putative lipoprotein YteS precursor [Halalkalibacter krulwichiae]